MNDLEICPRCGFSCSDVEFSTEIKNWPNHLPTPPDLPKTAHPHPVGVCCSPYEVAQKLYLVTPNKDIAPLLVRFKLLTEIESANFKLEDNEWIQTGPPKAFMATVRVLPEGIFECHKTVYDSSFLEGDIEVPVTMLNKVETWPTIEVG
jgi:hypothetical protein